uniref:Glycosyltransferase n=1 Tax=Thermofilum pendens TaxID=2269 RepID=A0A7C3SLN9_THEPE
MRQTVWMVTFEAAPLVKVGGLAEVPPSLAEELSKRGWKSTIILPAHGNVAQRGGETLGELSTSHCTFRLSRVKLGEVEYLLVSGGVLDDPRVYAEEVMSLKIAHFAVSVAEILKNAENLGLPEPSVVHFHDWHSVVPLLKVKQVAGYYGRPALIFHVHLALGKRLGEEILKAAGLSLEWEHDVTVGGYKRRVSLGEALRLSRGIAERLGALEADRVVTVSRTYMVNELSALLGGELAGKARVVYNGTSWRYTALIEEVLAQHGSGLKAFTGEWPPSRRTLRRYFLLSALGNIPPGEPRVLDSRLYEKLREMAAPPIKDDLRVESFERDGPLVITTGRLARQKGFDVLAEAIPYIVRELGTARFVLMVLPVWGGEDYAYQLVDLAREYPGNVRVIFGAVPTIYKLAHLSADVFAAPSRWEPFGIMALEAMAAGGSSRSIPGRGSYRDSTGHKGARVRRYGVLRGAWKSLRACR